jgi:hypothetical protein
MKQSRSMTTGRGEAYNVRSDAWASVDRNDRQTPLSLSDAIEKPGASETHRIDRRGPDGCAGTWHRRNALSCILGGDDD